MIGSTRHSSLLVRLLAGLRKRDQKISQPALVNPHDASQSLHVQVPSLVCISRLCSQHSLSPCVLISPLAACPSWSTSGLSTLGDGEVSLMFSSLARDRRPDRRDQVRGLFLCCSSSCHKAASIDQVRIQQSSQVRLCSHSDCFIRGGRQVIAACQSAEFLSYNHLPR